MKRAYLLLPRLDPFDAIANDVLGMADALQRKKYTIEILAAGGKLRGQFSRPSANPWKHAKASDILIYHYGIAWEAGDQLFHSFPGKKILRFHNVTPAEFYEPYHSGIANACREGMRRVVDLSADRAWCVSPFNGETLRSAGWSGEIRTLPPYHRIEETAELELKISTLKKELKRTLASKNKGNLDLRLLFVGRLVPNKSLPETIRTIDASLPPNLRCNLRIVGSTDSALSEHLKEIREAIRSCKNLTVELCGRMDQQELKREFLMANALVTFSRHEGFCVPVVEAMALGLPVIAMNSPAVQSTLGGCGYWASNTEELARSFQALASGDASIDRAVEDGLRRYLTRFAPSKLDEDLDGLLDDVRQESETASAEKPTSVDSDTGLKAKLETELAQHQKEKSASSGQGETTESREHIALVVVRFGEEFAGGSEKEAFDYAHLLTADGYDVDVFTTCARSADTWANEYARGIAIEDATESSLALRTGNDERSSSGALNKVGTLRIFRFPVNKTRSQYWHSLDALLDDPAVLQWVQAGGHAFALEWMRAQGPYSPDLVQELRRISQGSSPYHRYLYMTYLYYPVFYGSLISPSAANYLVPTLHDERPSYFRIVSRLPHRFRNILWNTAEEGKLAENLWNTTGGSIVGAPLTPPPGAETGSAGEAARAIFEASGTLPGTNAKKDSAVIPTTDSRHQAKTDSGSSLHRQDEGIPVFLYLGRWNAGKGIDQMISLLEEYNSIRKIQLIIAGGGDVRSIPPFAQHSGFVSEEAKVELIRQATALIVPSSMESFSIVTLEAMAIGTPVIVNGNNPVLAGHAERSRCALTYTDAAEFMACLDRSIRGLDSATLNSGMAYAGTFSPGSILDRLRSALQLGN